MVQEVAKLLAGKGVIVQINTQENPGLAARYEIKGIPTLIFFRDGKAGERVSGAMDRKNFLEWLSKRLT